VNNDWKIRNRLQVAAITRHGAEEGTVTLVGPRQIPFEAYFYRCNFEVGKTYALKFEAILHPLEWKVIFSKNRLQKCEIVPQGDFCACLAYGKIISIHPLVVDFGDIVMELGEWTNDPDVIGAYVYFCFDQLHITQICD
jgi:hypothetical protein